MILHDDLGPDARADEVDVLAQADLIESALGKDGHTTCRCAFSLDRDRMGDAIRSHGADVVFNLVESVGGQGRLIHTAPALLDALGAPYTGAPTEAMFLTSHKVLAKQWMHARGLPTPMWYPRGGAGETAANGQRFIIKSVWEDASLGLEDDAVVAVANVDDLAEIIRARASGLGGEAFAEAYIEGREINLSVLAGLNGPVVLPPAEIRFVDYDADRPRVVGYRAKWDAASFEYHHTPRCFDFPASDSGLLDELRALALRCWDLFGLRGYARVDFRVDESGRAWILEANANPCLAPDAGFIAAADRAGLERDEVIARILDDAGCRGGGVGGRT